MQKIPVAGGLQVSVSRRITS